MKTFFKSIFLLLFLVFISCDNDDDNIIPPPEGDFVDGFFVLNEGGFSSPGGVTFIADDFSRVEQNVFSAVNENEELGLFPQHIFFDQNDLAYIISNGSNLITVVNRFSLEKVGEITTNLDIPRFGTVLNGKAYVTNQASFDTGADDFVTVINLENFSVETTIPLMNTAEFIQTDGVYLYVQNASFGTGNAITVIDPESNSIETTVETGENLQNIALSGDTLYALHGNGIDRINLNNFEVLSTIDFEPGLDAVRNLTINIDQFYYTNGSNVFRSSIDDSTLSDEPLIEGNTQSITSIYGFTVNDGLVYVADAINFSSDGEAFIYDTNGNLVFETSVGLSPNGFYFN
jgi:DNA-binding beta-propeller fold protein YncE